MLRALSVDLRLSIARQYTVGANAFTLSLRQSVVVKRTLKVGGREEMEVSIRRLLSALSALLNKHVVT